jgi:hypothetical protein
MAARIGEICARSGIIALSPLVHRYATGRWHQVRYQRESLPEPAGEQRQENGVVTDEVRATERSNSLTPQRIRPSG